MSLKDELNRIAELLTGSADNGGSKLPILRAIADTLEGDNLTGAWGDGQVDIGTVELAGATIDASQVSGYADGIGRAFAFSFEIEAEVSESTNEATTLHFEATMPRDIPEDFGAVGQGYAHTTDGAGNYLPCNVIIGPSAEGGKVMDVHMVFNSSVPDGTYNFSGYVMAMLPKAQPEV